MINYLKVMDLRVMPNHSFILFLRFSGSSDHTVKSAFLLFSSEPISFHSITLAL